MRLAPRREPSNLTTTVACGRCESASADGTTVAWCAGTAVSYRWNCWSPGHSATRCPGAPVVGRAAARPCADRVQEAVRARLWTAPSPSLCTTACCGRGSGRGVSRPRGLVSAGGHRTVPFSDDFRPCGGSVRPVFGLRSRKWGRSDGDLSGGAVSGPLLAARNVPVHQGTNVPGISLPAGKNAQ